MPRPHGEPRGGSPAPTGPAAERALVVAVDLRDRRRPLEPELAEFEALIEAAGARLAGRVVQRLERIDPATLVGSGKAAELAQLADDLRATKLFVFNDLRPRQRTALEKLVPLPIVDRTMVILDVFAQRARSREGKLQVELAQLRYRQANLIGVGAALSRLGGGVGTRGPGETKLETDRRKIQARVTTVRRELAEVSRARTTRRADDRAAPLVALVGYTNVGKSSLLNRLAHAGERGAFVADQPFATLDPTVRRIYLAPGRFARLADTVGFITDLPEELVAAFRGTLEELAEAAVLVHVIDASSADWPRQQASVEAILRELELEATPRLLVANKSDAARQDAEPLPPHALAVSAREGTGLDVLRKALVNALDAPHKPAIAAG
ncbi:MAG: GTPase HflX [Vulcanimicrobiaceae bacterium]